jgi:hypothetical protein
MANDELYTPKIIFDKLRLEFDLDVASGANENIVVPAHSRFTIEQDALVQDWYGRVWMNPPFSKPSPWAHKWLEHGNGVCLVPLSSNGKWVNELWSSDAAVTYLPANMAFVNRNGESIKHRWRCSMWALGAENVEALKGISKVR